MFEAQNRQQQRATCNKSRNEEKFRHGSRRLEYRVAILRKNDQPSLRHLFDFVRFCRKLVGCYYDSHEKQHWKRKLPNEPVNKEFPFILQLQLESFTEQLSTYKYR